MAEELWERIGGTYSVHRQPWPVFDRAALVDEMVTVAVQVNGRVRDRVTVPAGSDRDHVMAAALQRPARVVGPGGERGQDVRVAVVVGEVELLCEHVRCHARGRLGVEVPLALAGVVDPGPRAGALDHDRGVGEVVEVLEAAEISLQERASVPRVQAGNAGEENLELIEVA